MNSAIERLLGLRVGDIMNAPVATVQENSLLSDAAKLMIENGVSGLPVVDVTGRSVGILTASDFAAREYRMAVSDERQSFGGSHALQESGPLGSLQIDAMGNNLVRDHMSGNVQTISLSGSLINAARVMCREHIHRLVIVDDDHHPVGMISSLDLVAAMVAAVEE